MPEIKEATPLIQFINSNHQEQFKIPDGESIRITYPLDDGREPVELVCKFIGEYHTKVGNSTYHICEFAEIMERIHARFEPVNQLQNIEITPFAEGEDKFYTYNREEGNTCAGSLHGDFGHNGDRYYTRWNERENGLYNADIQSEIQSVVFALRQDLLKDRDSMLDYCKCHPEAKNQREKRLMVKIIALTASNWKQNHASISLVVL